MPVLARRRDLTGAPMQRWQPFPEIQHLEQQMGELVERLMSQEDGGVWTPFVDIEETEDAWILEADVPGARSEDVDVEVGENEVAITGEIKERERVGILRRRTRRVGRFEFRVTLPGGTDPNSVQADLDNGVLTVRIPKPDIARPRHIEVRSGHGENGQAAQPQQAAQPAHAPQA